GFRGRLSCGRRRTDYLQSSGIDWFGARENDEIGFDGGYSGGGRIFDIFFTHRRNRDLQSGLTSYNDLARFRCRDSWESLDATSDISYRISSGEDRRLEKAVVYVGEKQGDYDEEGREVGQKRGDYMVLYLPGGKKEAVRTVELSWRLSIGGVLRGLGNDTGGGGWLDRIRRNVSCDHFFSVTERSRTDDLVGLYTLSPSLLQRDDVTIYGANKIRQEWNFFNAAKKFNLRITYSREDEEDNRSQGMETERFTRDVSVLAEAAPFSSFTLSWEAGTGLRERDSQGLSGQNYRVETFSAAQVLNYRFGPSTRFSFELGFEKRQDELSSSKQRSFIAAPSFTSSVGARFHVTTFMKFTYTDAQFDKGKPLFFLEEGLRQDWSLIGQYRFTRNVSFGANYTGRREKDFLGEVKTIHDLKMESRAYF
ncbi:MAG: hypothetical protein KAX38_09875, partial [Candidatus Krumholzibacteria bacterium]|nr:hypothetical protein [Candidatus Krumholzibacteria bacterium]